MIKDTLTSWISHGIESATMVVSHITAEFLKNRFNQNGVEYIDNIKKLQSDIEKLENACIEAKENLRNALVRCNLSIVKSIKSGGY